MNVLWVEPAVGVAVIAVAVIFLENPTMVPLLYCFLLMVVVAFVPELPEILRSFRCSLQQVFVVETIIGFAGVVGVALAS